MAFALSVALFIYFWGLGYVIVWALHTRRDMVRNALLGPSVGVVATIYPIYVLNRLGLPVGTFAHALTGVTMIIAIAAWVWWRPQLPGRRLLPYIAIVIFGFGLTGWPLLAVGFGWFGTVNPDMTNYVLDAQRFVDQPFLRMPDPDIWLGQSDWSAYYVIFPAFGIRSASDLLLAWVIALTGKVGSTVYMSLMVALHVSLVLAATALISTPYRFARLLATTVMCASAMLSLGVVVQLFGQILGLLLLCLGCALYLSPFYRLARNALIRFAMLASAVLAVLVLSYPEVAPFLALAFIVYHSIGVHDIRPYVVRGLLSLLSIAAIAIALTAPDVLALLSFMFQQMQISAGAMRRHDALFPYFLIPAAWAKLWGLSIYYGVGGALLPAGILCGMILTVFTLISAIWLAWRREVVAVVTLVMAGLGIVLLAVGSGFGTFKLAMYIQPFLLTTAVLSGCVLLGASTKRLPYVLLVTVLIAGIAAANLRTQFDTIASTLSQSVGLKTAITRLQEPVLRSVGGALLMDVPEFGQMTFLAAFTRGRTVTTVSGEAGWRRVRARAGGDMPPLFSSDVRNEILRLQSISATQEMTLQFDLGEGSLVHLFNRLKDADYGFSAKTMMLAPAADQSVVNSSHKRPVDGRYYFVPVASVRNHLGLVDSTLGRTVSPGNTSATVALWQRERDFASSGGIQAAGRHILFEVFNANPGSRLLLEFTRGPLAADGQALPPAKVIGLNLSEVGFVGYGAARMLSPPVTARTVGGRTYLAIDMSIDPQGILTPRSGLANLYNRHITLDHRTVVGWVRNISLLGADEAAAMAPPAAIDRFPASLFHEGLLFSGLAEDGWMAETARVRLAADDAHTVRVIGNVPNIADLASGLTIELMVDGQPVTRRTVKPGDFELEAALPEESGPRWVELRADKSIRLSGPDTRRVSLLVKSIALRSERAAP
jgi:hypothetical protein